MKERIKGWLLDKRTGRTEWIVLAVWVVLVCIIRHFHEPWFDETQAWQIARFASVKELLTEVEHYEGHPPLWHLLLMPFAKAELPYQTTIFCISLAFNIAALMLLLFRSPFPRWLRCYLPFTFYIFYMHGVHTRPYCMTMLAFFLLAMAYRSRNEKPGRYVLSMCFLCLTTALGLLFSFGFCIIWLWEILQEYRTGARKPRELVRDKRFWWLLLLAALAFLICLCISSAPDEFNSGDLASLKARVQRLYFLPLFMFDATFGAILLDDTSPQSITMVILGAVIGCLLWALFLPLLKKNGRLLICVVPYLIAALFGALVYFSVHHLEIYQLFFIFILWILFQDGIELPEIYGRIREKLDSRLTVLLLEGVALAALCAPVVYACGSACLDIRFRYGPYEKVQFIKEHHLENRKIFTRWVELSNNQDEESGMDLICFDETLPPLNYPETELSCLHLMGDASTIYAFFDRDADFFTYFNVTDAQQKWMLWKKDTPEEQQEILRRWAEIGLPDFVIGTAPLQEIFPEDMLEGVTYYWVDDVHSGKIWKLDYMDNVEHIYIRGDLLDEYPDFHIHTYAEEAKKK